MTLELRGSGRGEGRMLSAEKESRGTDTASLLPS